MSDRSNMDEAQRRINEQMAKWQGDGTTELRARIERLEKALQMFACDCTVENMCSVPDNCRNYLARAALEDK